MKGDRPPVIALKGFPQGCAPIHIESLYGNRYLVVGTHSWEYAMQVEKQVEEWHFDTAPDGDKDDVIDSKSPEDSADRFGVNLSLLILCVALLIAALGLMVSPSFEKCSALANVTQRNACYGELRNDLMKPPAKGGEMPTG
jgi:hypothetical protein